LFFMMLGTVKVLQDAACTVFTDLSNDSDTTNTMSYKTVD